MKKTVKYIFLVLIILFSSGCSTHFYILQTLDNGALACEGNTCDTYTTTHCGQYGCYSNRHQPLLVFIDKIDGIEYYDGLIFELPKNLDVYQDVLYQYVNTNGARKTIPHWIFVNKKKNNTD